MKILIVTREANADKSYGLGRSLLPLLTEFSRRGIAVDYICQSNLSRQTSLWQRRCFSLGSVLLSKWPTETDFLTLLQVLLERLNMGRLAAKLSAAGGYTHVHCHDPFIAAGFRFFLSFYPGRCIHWGITEHGFGCYSRAIQEDGVKMSRYVSRLMSSWEARTLIAASWVVAPTQLCLNQIAGDLKISPVPKTWYSILHARPLVNQYSRREARYRLGWSTNVIYILSVGRIAPVKQFPLLIEACSKLDLPIDFKLVILGDGNRDALKKQARQLRFAHEILFEVTDDIGLYLCASDLYVSTSASESFGLANLEALTVGAAAVCTAVGGVPEVVGEGALLCESSANAIAQAMHLMLSDTRLRQLIAKKGWERAKAWPGIIEIANQYEAVYRYAAAR